MSEKVPGEFVSLLRHHLEVLDASQSELAKDAGVSTSQVSGWLANRDRSVSRADVVKVAWALAGLYRKNKVAGGRYKGPEHTDYILKELLRAAGFRAGLAEGDRDLVWNTKLAHHDATDLGSPRKLKVGWFDWYPFVFRPQHSKKLSGVSYNCAQLAASFLNIELEWVQCESPAHALRTGEIDLMAPQVMAVHARMYDYLLSDPIPMIRVGVNVVVKDDYRSRVRVKEFRDDGPLLELERARLVVLAHEFSRTLRSLFDPFHQVEVDRIGSSLEDICRFVVEQPLVDEPEPQRVRCFLTDSLTAAKAPEFAPGASQLLTLEQSNRLPVFGLSFAVHGEEWRLRDALNACLEAIQQCRLVPKLIRGYEGVLRAAGALPSTRDNLLRETLAPKIEEIRQLMRNPNRLGGSP